MDNVGSSLVWICILSLGIIHGLKVPTRIWPLTRTTFGIDTVNTQDSIARLHGCTFDDNQNEPEHPYPALVLGGGSFVDIPLTEASVGGDRGEGIEELSLTVYVYIPDQSTNGVVFEYRDFAGVIYFQVSFENSIPKFTPSNLGKCVNAAFATEPLINGWNHLSVIRTHGDGKFQIYMGKDQIMKPGEMDCDDNYGIPVPGVLRVGASHGCSGHLRGLISCVRVFKDKIGTGGMTGIGCQDNDLPWSFTDEDLQKTCQQIITPDCKEPPTTTPVPSTTTTTTTTIATTTTQQSTTRAEITTTAETTTEEQTTTTTVYIPTTTVSLTSETTTEYQTTTNVPTTTVPLTTTTNMATGVQTTTRTSTAPEVLTTTTESLASSTAAPAEYMKRYYKLRKRDGGIQSNTHVLEDILINGRSRCSKHCHRQPSFQCGAYCLRLDDCLAFAIQSQNISVPSFSCRLYSAQHEEVDYVDGSRYYEVKTRNGDSPHPDLSVIAHTP